MKIKEIRNLKLEITKGEFKKRIAQVSVLSLGVLFTIVGPKVQDAYQEAQYKIEQQKLEEENAEKKISLLSCRILVENCSDGTVKHHFIDKDYETNWEKYADYDEWNYQYRAITDKNFLFTDSEIVYNTASYFDYKKTPETNGRYIFDYNVAYYLFDTTDISLPENYSLDELYSINELKELEEKLNVSIYEQKGEKEAYYINCLYLIEVNGEFMCFDMGAVPTEVTETIDKTDVQKLRTVYYFPSVSNNLLNLKVNSGMSAVEDKVADYSIYSIPITCVFEDIACLNKTVRISFNGQQLIQHNLHDYLTEEQILKGKITDVEICELLEQLNNQNYKLMKKMGNE